jgi:hypothetical protein
MKVSLPIERSEWITLDAAIRAANNLDVPFNPSLNFNESFGSYWEIDATDGSVVIIPHLNREGSPADLPAGFPVHLPLPTGLAIYAAHLVADRQAGVEVSLVFDDNFVGVESDSGASAFSDHVPSEELARPLGPSTGSSAVVQAGDLCNAMYAVTRSVGPTNKQIPLPIPQIGIEDNALGFSADWTPFGLPQMTYRVPAQAKASDVRVGIYCSTAARLLEETASETPVEVVIYENLVRFSSTDPTAEWTVLALHRETGARRWLPQLEKAFKESGHHLSIDGDGNFITSGVSGEAEEVTVGLHGTDPETIRLTLCVGSNFEETSEFHAQVNLLNAKKSSIRFWFDNGSLMACQDLPCQRFEDAPAAAEHLQREIDGLGLLVSAAF